MKYLINTTEVYRVANEDEAKKLIEDAKKDGNFILSKYSSEKREKKVKGEVEDEWFRVKLVKVFTDEKEPEYSTDISYEVNAFPSFSVEE